MSAKSSFQPVIFGDLNSPWEKVLSLGILQSFSAKTIIPARSRGDVGVGMYYIRRGCVRLSNITPSGREKIMLYMARGMIFNEIAMFHSLKAHLFTCMEATETVFIPQKRITVDFIRDHPELILNLIESVTKKSASFYVQLFGLRAFDTFVNVCRVLYSMYLFNRSNGNVVPRLSQQELAAFLGIHRSSLHKALLRLKKEGIIGSYHRRNFAVHSPERLLAYSEGA
jgi:CRP-like cAMP-binding protein